MIAMRWMPLVLRQVLRARTRSLLTVAGVGVAMFLFSGVQALQAGVALATEVAAGDTQLVVYRKDRFCPFTSRLPQWYEQRIRAVPGVTAVVPIAIAVSNCRTSLDVVTFRGVPAEDFASSIAPRLELVAGTLADWERRSDAALLGETLARRRGLRVGDRFDAAGITASVAGIVRSRDPQDQNVAYVHLPFLQFASGSRAGGLVTQFNVQVRDPQQVAAVCAAIDAQFADAPEPTATSPEKDFVARAAADVLEVVGFTYWLGWGCLLAVLALVGNAIFLSVQDRVREHAILQTLGFRGDQIARLILAEGLVLSLAGALLGALAANLLLGNAALAVSVESSSIPIRSSPAILALSTLLAAATGVLAGLIPAVQAARREIVSCFRAI